MSARGLRGRSSTNNLSDLKYLFELHVCFYFNCDFWMRRTHRPQNWLVLTAIAGRRTCTGMVDDKIEFWLRIFFWFS
jgi:hypothetical protein